MDETATTRAAPKNSAAIRKAMIFDEVLFFTDSLADCFN